MKKLIDLIKEVGFVSHSYNTLEKCLKYKKIVYFSFYYITIKKYYVDIDLKNFQGTNISEKNLTHEQAIDKIKIYFAHIIRKKKIEKLISGGF